MGEYSLPDGADEARVVHFNEADNTDSVVAASLCAEFTATDDPDAALQDEDEDEDEDEDQVFTLEELLEQNAEGGELALTGANEIAFAVIALGVMVLGLAAKVQGKDPEDFKY